MRRAFKGKLCVYCVKAVCESDDHVIARELFPKDDRANLPKVPSCKKCNNAKAALERYATCVLPFGSEHPDALKIVTESMPERLQKNQNIQRELIKGQGRMLAQQPNGIFTPTTTFKVDATKVAELARYIVQGLIYHHWDTYLKREESDISIMTARVEGDGFTRAAFDELMGRYNALALHVRENLGNGTARYEGIGVKLPDQPVISIWRLQLLDSIYAVEGGPARGFLITTTARQAGFGEGIPAPDAPIN